MSSVGSALSRRLFLQRGATVSAYSLLRVPHESAHTAQWPETYDVLEEPAAVRRLAERALDAARSAGVPYADVRLTRTLSQRAGGNLGLHFTDREALGVGVRAFVDGAWGFAASAYWTDDEVVRIAQMAAAQAREHAKINALMRTMATEAAKFSGKLSPVTLAPAPAVTGSWVMPIREDPFRIPWETKLNVIQATTDTARQLLPRHGHPQEEIAIPFLLSVVCWRQEQAIATSEGTYVTQTIYQTGGELKVVALGNDLGGSASATGLELCGRGWEIFADAQLLTQIPALVDAAEAETAMRMAAKRVEVGQYDLVCDAVTMASLIEMTFGRATALDRALGYEANAGGTSYLGPDPFAWLGQPVASPFVNVTANRSQAGALGTVQWDAEGVVPQDVSLVTAGHLVNYQTTRALAPWLTSWYQQHHQPVQSQGCATVQDAKMIPLSMTPNLVLTPTPAGPSWDTLLAGISKGIAVQGGTATTDFQAKTGVVRAGMYEVKAGKRVACLTHGGVLFTAPKLWKNVTAVGGSADQVSFAEEEVKGEPVQRVMHTVTAVPAVITSQSVIDVTRKA